MKKNLLLPILLSLLLAGCKVNRHYFVMEESVPLYLNRDFSDKPDYVLSVGDTVSSTGTRYMQLGGKVPVEYRGYRFYTPFARARHLRTARINPYKSRTQPGTLFVASYHSKVRINTQAESLALPSNYGYTPSTGAYIHTGPRSGRYYINKNGNKTYVPRNSGSSGAYRPRSSGGYRSSGGRGRH